MQVGKGSEFINKDFKNYMNTNNIEVQYINEYEKSKLNIINRMCRTLRGLINKYLSAYYTTRYIDVLYQLIDNYSNTIHSTIKITPNEANNHVNEINKINTLRYNKSVNFETSYNIGDKVRYIINLKQFEKNLYLIGVKLFIL